MRMDVTSSGQARVTTKSGTVRSRNDASPWTGKSCPGTPPRGAETSWYREAILTCPHLQRSCVSIAKNAIHKIRRLAMHPIWAPSLDGAAHSVHIVLWVKRLCWFERTGFMTPKFETRPGRGAKSGG